MKLFTLFGTLLFVSLCVEARSTHSRGRSCHKNFHFKQTDCRHSFTVKNMADLDSYNQQRLINRTDKNLVIAGDISSKNVRIETQCEVRVMPKIKIAVTEDLTIFAKELKLDAKTELSASDLYIKTDKDLKMTAGTSLKSNRLLLQTDDEIELKNPTSINTKLAILNAKRCEVHKKADFVSDENLGSCFNGPRALLKFDATPKEGNYPLVVRFNSDESFGLIDEFNYDFGDNETFSTTLNEVIYTYEATGTFQATLRAKGDFGILSAKPIEIKVNKPIDNFQISYAITRVNPPQVLMSADRLPEVNGGVKEYLWNFGDGSQISVPFSLNNFGTIYHDYAQDGVYTINLRARGQDDFVTAPAEQIIDTRNNFMPSPRYQISNFKGEAPFTVTVEALESVDPDGDPLHYYWSFSDTGEFIGPTTDRIKTHTFEKEGIYRIVLYTLDDKEAQRSVAIPIYVGATNSIPSLSPVAVVDTTERFGPAPWRIEMTAARSFDPDGVAGQALSYTWSFYDSGIDQDVVLNGVNFAYTFSKAGSYYPLLTVTDITGQSSSYRIPIFVSSAETASDTFLIRALDQKFTYEIDVTPLINGQNYILEGMTFDYGDASHSWANGPVLTKTYSQAGNYTVTVRARKIDGPYVEFTRYLSVTEDSIRESAFIMASSSKYNLNEPIHFNAILENENSKLNSTRFTWNMGNGVIIKGVGVEYQNITHIYSSTGSYDVTLLTEFESGLSSYSQYRIDQNQLPSMGEIKIYGNNPGSAPARIGFAPWESTTDFDGYISQYIYEWGDASQALVSNNGYEEHEFTTPGIYQVKITAIDDAGGKASNYIEVTINPNKIPVADFDIIYGGEIAPAWAGVEAWQKSFDEDGWIVEYEYDFGDGETLVTAEGYINHLYQNPGTYSVKMRVKDNADFWSLPVSKSVIVTENQAPILADFNLNLRNQYPPATTSIEAWPFSLDSDGYIVNYEYNWGDGTIDITSDGYVVHIYQDPGTYLVLVRVQDERGKWSNWISKELIILKNSLPDPQISLLTQNVYAPTTLKFSGLLSSDEDGQITNYEWTLSDGRLFWGEEIEIGFTSPGMFTINLKVLDDRGDVGNTSYSFVVNENHNPLASFEITKSEFKQFEIISLESLSYDQDINQKLTHFWEMSDGSTYIGKNVYHFFQSTGEHWIKLLALDESGGAHEKTLVVNIVENEHQPAIPKISIVGLEENNFDLMGSMNANSYSTELVDGRIVATKWEMGDGTVYENKQNVEHVYNKLGQYTIKLTVTTEYGVSSSDYKVVNVVALKKPSEIASPFELVVTGIQLDQYNPISNHITLSLSEGDFSNDEAFQLIIENDTDYRDLTASVLKVGKGKIDGDIQLFEGRNILHFYGYDHNGNTLVKSLEVWSGSRSVDIQLSSLSNSSTAGVKLFVGNLDGEYDVLNTESVTDTNGVARLVNLPLKPFFVFGVSEHGEKFSTILDGSGTNYLISNDNISAPTSLDSNQLSSEPTEWVFDSKFFSVFERGEKYISSFVVPGGVHSYYEKVFLSEKDRFFTYAINLLQLPENGEVEIYALNQSTGEIDIRQFRGNRFSQYVKNLKEVTVFAKEGDQLTVRVSVKTKADPISFIDKFLSAYASEENVVVIEGGSISEEQYHINLELIPQNGDPYIKPGNTNLNLTKLPKLSGGVFKDLNLDGVKSIENGLNGRFRNSAFIRGSETDDLYNLEILDIELTQVGLDEIKNTKSDLNISYQFDGESKFIIGPIELSEMIRFNTKLLPGVDVSARIKLLLTYNNGNKVEKYLSIDNQTVIPGDQLLFVHNLRTDKSHYGSYDMAAPTVGDFWSTPIVISLLDIFATQGVGFRVGDVANINGGSFKLVGKHSSHQDGSSFDAVTAHYGVSNSTKVGLTSNALDDLQKLLVDNSTVTENVEMIYTYFKNGSNIDLDRKNRCQLGITMDLFTKSVIGHHNHWHFNTGKKSPFPQPANRISQPYSKNVELTQDGYMLYTISYPISLARAAFRIYRKDTEPESQVFASYSSKTNEYSNSLFNVKFDGSKSLTLKFRPKNIAKINEMYRFTGLGVNSASYCEQREIVIDNIIDDCNDDGVKNDKAYVTEDGGFVSVDIDLPEGAFIKDGARLCGNSIMNAESASISGGFILENVEFGANCSVIILENNQSPVSKILDSKICNKRVLPSLLGNVLISGSSISITNGSQINGDLTITSESSITKSDIGGYESSIQSSTIDNSTVNIFRQIYGSLVHKSLVSGVLPSENNNFNSLNISGASISNSSQVKGSGIVNGIIDQGIFEGWGGFLRYDGFIQLHLFSSGSIVNGGVARQNGWIAGSIRDGGSGNFSGSEKFQSGVHWGAEIGSNGSLSCTSYVRSGSLHKSICGKVYWEGRSPDTMDINDWLDEKPWPTP